MKNDPLFKIVSVAAIAAIVLAFISPGLQSHAADEIAATTASAR